MKGERWSEQQEARSESGLGVKLENLVKVEVDKTQEARWGSWK